MPKKNTIYPITITPEQYDYVTQDLSVVPDQNIKDINLSTYNLCFTDSYSVKKFINNQMEKIIKDVTNNNISENKILCNYLDVSWFNIYKSLVANDENNENNEHGTDMAVEILQNNPQLLQQIVQQIGQNNNNTDELNDVNEDDYVEDEVEDDYVEDEVEVEDEYEVEDEIEDEYMNDNQQIDEINEINEIDEVYEDNYLEPVGQYEESTVDDDAPVYGSVLNTNHYDKLNVMLNSLYHKHMMRKYIINKYIIH